MLLCHRCRRLTTSRLRISANSPFTKRRMDDLAPPFGPRISTTNGSMEDKGEPHKGHRNWQISGITMPTTLTCMTQTNWGGCGDGDHGDHGDGDYGDGADGADGDGVVFVWTSTQKVL